LPPLNGPWPFVLSADIFLKNAAASVKIASPDDGKLAERASVFLPFIHVHRNGLRQPFRYKKMHRKSLSHHKGVCVGLRLLFYKAIYLEPTSDLTTENFLAAFAWYPEEGVLVKFISLATSPRSASSPPAPSLAALL